MKASFSMFSQTFKYALKTIIQKYVFIYRKCRNKKELFVRYYDIVFINVVDWNEK